ncbi:hypothetical protein ACFU99_05890 [Streptomyces sp. NPDC057654]|uniref:hypothetical protein n=1 Tax=Streptomyces sp. NPDC057654 TaxID=3346196 RepID=UPI00367A2D02
MPTQAETPKIPGIGWFVDLDDHQLEGLIGAMVTVFSGARTATGILTDIEDGTAHIFNERYDKPATFQVFSTRYERLPGTPLRPALAAALVYQRSKDKQAVPEGKVENAYDYDSVRGAEDEGQGAVYEALVKESIRLLFGFAGEGLSR